MRGIQHGKLVAAISNSWRIRSASNPIEWIGSEAKVRGRITKCYSDLITGRQQRICMLFMNAYNVSKL